MKSQQQTSYREKWNIHLSGEALKSLQSLEVSSETKIISGNSNFWKSLLLTTLMYSFHLKTFFEKFFFFF